MNKWKFAVLSVFLAAAVITGCSASKKKVEEKKENVIAYGEGTGTQEESMEETAQQENAKYAASSGKAVPLETDFMESDSTLGGIPVISGEYSVKDCITLPDLDSIKGEYSENPAPSYKDARIYAMLQKDAYLLPENDDETAQYGDKVIIDLYVEGSSDDSVEGSLMDMEVPLGAGDVAPAIEEAIIGMAVGNDKEVTVKDDGGETIYKILLRSISRPDEPTELEIGDAEGELSTETQELEEYLHYSSIKQEIVEKSVVKAYPEKVMRQARSMYEEKCLRGSSLTDYLDQQGMTRAEFKQYEEEYATVAAKEMLVLEALCERSGITRTSKEYTEAAKEEGENPEDPDELLYILVLKKLFEK